MQPDQARPGQEAAKADWQWRAEVWVGQEETSLNPAFLPFFPSSLPSSFFINRQKKKKEGKAGKEGRWIF